MSLCLSEAFSFPSLLGTQLQSITATSLKGYTDYAGFKPELALMGPEGVHACNITVLYTHPGHNDNISVQVWLPTREFSNRYVGVGGGGWSASELGNDIMSTLVSQGHAVATTNAGYSHDIFGTADPWLMPNAGNLNYPLVVNFAHRSLHEMAVIAKHIINNAYGAPPEYSYWHGCSTGGRQGLTISQKYPEDYDGILTSCTAVHFPALLMSMYWPQLVMNQESVYPSACEFEAITTAMVAACEEEDEVPDGIVADPELCTVDPESLIDNTFDCDGKSSSISAGAVKVYKALLKGPVDPEGNQLFPGLTIGTSPVGLMALANTVCEDGHCTRGRPFTIADDWIRLMVKADPEFDPAKMSHTEYAQLFRDSIRKWEELFESDNADLQQFRQLGKKMISWHSSNDEAVTPKAMRQYYERVLAFDQARNVTTQDYYRYFEVPGATHCTASVGVPYPLNALDVLRAWVEHDIAPEQLPTTRLGMSTAIEEIKRPICMYPQRAVLMGSEYFCRQETMQIKDDKRRTRDEL